MSRGRTKVSLVVVPVTLRGVVGKALPFIPRSLCGASRRLA